jgi:hypothetical protein
MATYDVNRVKIYGHMKDQEGPHEPSRVCHHLGSPYPLEIRFAIVFGNFSPAPRRRSTPGWAG